MRYLPALKSEPDRTWRAGTFPKAAHVSSAPVENITFDAQQAVNVCRFFLPVFRWSTNFQVIHVSLHKWNCSCLRVYVAGRHEVKRVRQGKQSGVGAVTMFKEVRRASHVICMWTPRIQHEFTTLALKSAVVAGFPYFSSLQNCSKHWPDLFFLNFFHKRDRQCVIFLTFDLSMSTFVGKIQSYAQRINQSKIERCPVHLQRFYDRGQKGPLNVAWAVNWTSRNVPQEKVCGP